MLLALDGGDGSDHEGNHDHGDDYVVGEELTAPQAIMMPSV